MNQERFPRRRPSTHYRRPPLRRYPHPPQIRVEPHPHAEPKSSGSKTWIILGIVVVLIVFIILILLIPKSSKISENDLNYGVSIGLEEGKSSKFEFNDEAHKITLKSVGADSVEIVVESTKKEAILRINEVAKFDLNEDGTYDLRVRLRSLGAKRATLVVKRISESTCEPDWDCGVWGSCVEEIQTRICIDLNDCGSSLTKPDEEKDCVQEPTCSEQNASICNSTQICTGTIINASDSSACCSGDCEFEVIEPPIPENISCEGTWGCFINASKNCTPAKMTYDLVIPFFGIIESRSTTLIELKGIEDSKCIYYERILNSTVQLNQTLVQTLLDQGNITQEEVDAQNEVMNVEARRTIGNQYTCKFADFSNLTLMFERWEQGNFSFGFSCSLSLEESSCNRTGDFEGVDCTQSCYSGSYCEQFLTECPVYNLREGIKVTLFLEDVEVTAMNMATNSTTLNVSGTVDTLSYLQNKTISGLKIKNLGITAQNLTSLEVNCGN